MLAQMLEESPQMLEEVAEDSPEKPKKNDKKPR